jgi:hypothetical protein
MNRQKWKLIITERFYRFLEADSPTELLDALLTAWAEWLAYKGDRYYSPTLTVKLSSRDDWQLLGMEDVCVHWPACWSLAEVGDMVDEQAHDWFAKVAANQATAIEAAQCF